MKQDSHPRIRRYGLNGLPAIILAAIAALVCFSLAALSVCHFQAEIDIWKAFQVINTPSVQKADIPSMRAVRLNPHNGYARFIRGAFLRRTRRNEEAISELQTALSLIPHPANVHRTLAEIFFEEKRRELSAEHFGKALFFNPAPKTGPVPAWLEYSNSLQNAGMWGPALAALRRARRLGAPPETIRPPAALMLAALGADAASAREYLAAVRAQSSLREEFPSWALALTRLGRNRLGADIFSRFEQNGWLDARGLCLLASFHLHDKRYDDALDALNRAGVLNPDEPNIFLLRGEVYHKTGQRELMAQNYTRFIELYPDAPQRRQLEERMKP
ncbi:MAG TPA: tetratricopeptide repeat protein [Candidatus Sumerlaeota bacterium]|nr:tetratricopeptide repeat protein [Candidatus Sumerlaeota bacterium]